MRRNYFVFAALLIGLVLSGCFGSDSLEELRKSGYESLEKREFAQARGYFLKALEQDARDKETLVGLAQAYRQDSRYDSAIYYYKRADLMHPKDREILQQIREVAVVLGDWQNAIDAIESMIRLGDPKDMWHEQLADLWLKNGQPGRAFFHARRAVVYGTNNPAIYLQAANWAAQHDSTSAAFEIFDSAIAKFGPLDPFVVNKALLLSMTGQQRQAEALIREAVERESPPPPDLQFNLANILASQPERAKKQEALTIYRELGNRYPGQFQLDSLISALDAQLK
jgi:tetratricopeptide (TPR) repeat protein